MSYKDEPITAPSPLDEAGLCLLSLDGGGVRGLSTLLILKALMDRTNAERQKENLPLVKPCEIFDMIGGTSTGGLIAIMLGHLKMDVDECIEAYTGMFKKIFNKKKHALPITFRGKVQGKFDSEALKKAVTEIVEAKGFAAPDLFNGKKDGKCHVFVCATAVENKDTMHIRDYNVPDEFHNDGATIVDAALATSAATTFFEPVTIGGRRYVDGALGANNPVDSVWKEAQNLWCAEDGKLEPLIKCFISLGTGVPGSVAIKDDAKGFLTKSLKEIATETQRTAEKFASRHRGLLDQKRYFRYNVEQGLQTVGLEEYGKQSNIEAATLSYTSSQTQKFKIRDCATNLKAKRVFAPPDLSDQIEDHFKNVIIASYVPVDCPSSEPPDYSPKIHFLVPFPSSESFTGREEVMLRVSSALSAPGTHNRVALVGLGGIGKTRIALETALKHKESKSTSVFWVHAGSAARVEKAYNDIAVKVGIPGWASQSAVHDKLSLVKNWLESEASGNWLLILDNADDVNIMYGSPESDDKTSLTRLAAYIPRCSNGSILLTTRTRKVAGKFAPMRNVISLDALTIDEAERLLADKLGGDEEGAADRSELATVLERVPLALVQATAYISTQCCSISEYLDLYRESDENRIGLLSDDFEDDVRDSDIKNPVATTFHITFRHIEEHDRTAADMLSFMSMLDTQAVPESLLPFDENRKAFIEALGTLQAYCLISKREDSPRMIGVQGRSFYLHRLVGIAMRNWLGLSGQLEYWTGEAIKILDMRIPEGNSHEQELWLAYIPHALSLLNSDQSKQLEYGTGRTTQQGTLADLLHTVAWCLESKGDFLLATSLSQRCAILRTRVLGPEHHKTLASKHNTAEYLRQQGKWQQAKDIFREVMNLRIRLLGIDDPDTLITMSCLSLALCDNGEYDESEKMRRETLELQLKVHGEEHFDTLVSMHNLALVLDCRGNYEEAKKLYTQTLEIKLRVLGAKHPETLRTQDELAEVLRELGEYTAARMVVENTVEVWRGVVGLEHPDTVHSMTKLGNIQAELGDYDASVIVLRQALTISQRVLGPEHPDTLHCMSSLADIMADLGQYEDSMKLQREALELKKIVSGPEHADSLYSMTSLADVLADLGQYDEAFELVQTALAVKLRDLGPEHPDTLTSMAGLTEILFNQRKHDEAVEMGQRTFDLRQKVLGPDHPRTLKCGASLARMKCFQHKYDEAEKMLRDISERQKSAFGTDHPDTLKSLSGLAMALCYQQQYDEAEAICERTLEARRKLLRPDHPHIIQTEEDLEWIREERGMPAEEKCAVKEQRLAKSNEKEPEPKIEEEVEEDLITF